MHAAAPSPILIRQRWFLLGLGAFFLLVSIQYLLKVQLSAIPPRVGLSLQ